MRADDDRVARALDGGLAAHRRGDLDAAEQAYRRVLQAVPEHPDARHLLGVALLQRGRAADAEREIARALAQRPEDAVFCSNLGEALRAQGRLEEAEQALRRAVSLAPAQADARNNLGLVLLASGRAEDAVAALREADRLAPDSPETVANLATALRAAGQRPEAERALAGLLARTPGFGDGRLLLCRLLLEDARVDDARRCAREGEGHVPEHAATQAALALVAAAGGEYGAAGAHADDAMRRPAGSASAALACASVFLDIGRHRDAAALLARVDAAQPGQVDVLALLARATLECDDLDASHAACVRLVAACPESAGAHLAMAKVLRRRERLEEAEDHVAAARRLDPDLVSAVVEAADLSRTRNDTNGARATLEAGLRQFPGHPDLLKRLATVSLEAGDTQAARRILRDRLAEQPDDVAAHHRLALCGHAEDVDRGALETLVALLASGRVPPPAAAAGHFAAAKMLDDLDDFDAPGRAFAHYRTANRLRREAEAYDRQAFERHVGQCIEGYTAQRIARLRGHGSASRVPIVIAGMPRSGTTLVEQILASHPRVAGAGEIDTLARLAPGPQAPLAQALDALDAASVQRLADTYLARLRRDHPRCERVTDKTPRNFMALGLAAILVPNAVLVHCRREPIDTCLSIYFQDLDRGHEFAYDPQSIAHHYAGYRRLMAHWQRVLPVPILHVDYECVVSDLEGECRRLLEFCGLEWDSRCLEFHRQSRTVRTSSLWQVRQPVYTSSTQRWRRYGADVAPLRDALAAQGIEVPDLPA